MMSHLLRRGMQALAFSLLVLLSALATAQETVISAPAASALVAEEKLILIDIRTPEEWRQTGIPSGAKRIDLRNPEGPLAFLDQVLAAVGGDKTQPIGLICRTGNRSTQAQRFLQAKGFTNVVNVKEGVMGNETGPGWIKDGLPVDACSTC